jgi:hypothetical protein
LQKIAAGINIIDSNRDKKLNFDTVSADFLYILSVNRFDFLCGPAPYYGRGWDPVVPAVFKTVGCDLS